ncbi:hypothetical protein CAMRE0001_1159 [Campylobacter rectus RM3267]|uniref:Uncharacterized protein n=1 Tax=Campylobacter rectus RM3267 TaxID=553218 RepID=B9D0F5_CAMRE|nr:hypothetical protein CAMRE0001_1159 [Campylobacter rectus RM3267]
MLPSKIAKHDINLSMRFSAKPAEARTQAISKTPNQSKKRDINLIR